MTQTGRTIVVGAELPGCTVARGLAEKGDVVILGF